MNRFTILGHPVVHSLSPKFHNAVFRKRGLKNYHYDVYDCPPEKLSKAMDKIRAGEYQGYSVTIPLKEAVIPYLDELSSIAKKIGAVNTIIRKENGKLLGDNTDYEGFKKALEEACVIARTGMTALVLGSGGASKAIIAVLLGEGWKVKVATRGKKIQIPNSKFKFQTYEELNPNDDYDFIVNTTPLGMSPHTNESPLTDPAWFRKDRIYFDVIYTPKMTKFLKLAKKTGAKIITGDRMFYWQALSQSKLFFIYVFSSSCYDN